ncbi:Na+/H+ antiporter subunit E [Spiribacter sp. 218]|uniref:Na+/H+ antiporter subunit E n=1 Tax=Spiribacter pallidus TaxID=1987936 RepID=UPI00349F8AA3
MRYFISLSLMLAALWLSLSGVYKPLIFGLGGASIALVVWLTERMEVLGAEHDAGLWSWRLPVYWGWLLWQVVLANLMVSRAVLSRRPIRPRLLQVRASQQTLVGRVTYGNSITLTPGTITTDLPSDDEDLQVHALLPAAAEDLRSGEMARRVDWLENGR